MTPSPGPKMQIGVVRLARAAISDRMTKALLFGSMIQTKKLAEGVRQVPLMIEDPQKLCRDVEEYVHTVIALLAADECGLEAAAIHVIERLSAVLEAMFEGISAADAARALDRSSRQAPPLSN